MMDGSDGVGGGSILDDDVQLIIGVVSEVSPPAPRSPAAATGAGAVLDETTEVVPAVGAKRAATPNKRSLICAFARASRQLKRAKSECQKHVQAQARSDHMVALITAHFPGIARLVGLTAPIQSSSRGRALTWERACVLIRCAFLGSSLARQPSHGMKHIVLCAFVSSSILALQRRGLDILLQMCERAREHHRI